MFLFYVLCSGSSSGANAAAVILGACGSLRVWHHLEPCDRFDVGMPAQPVALGFCAKKARYLEYHWGGLGEDDEGSAPTTPSSWVDCDELEAIPNAIRAIPNGKAKPKGKGKAGKCDKGKAKHKGKDKAAKCGKGKAKPKGQAMKKAGKDEANDEMQHRTEKPKALMRRPASS